MGDVVFMVRAGSRADCQRELDRLCRLLGARPALLPTDVVGPGWVARAVGTAKAPAGDDPGRGPAVL